MKKIGLYLWGGPGIIDLLKVKYPNPKIDIEEHWQAYDDQYLAKAKNILGVTDLWVTFSWGFSDYNERHHRQFIKDKLSSIKKHGFTVHGYVQGFNLVTNDFYDQDVFCRDHHNKLMPYSRGRSFICPNNPEALKIIKERVNQACQLDFDGIYIDNIFFGLFPFFVFKNLTSFFGCSCYYCQKEFKKTYGYDLPLGMKKGQNVIKDYLEFRSDSIYKALKIIQKTAKKHKKLFGVNLYDFKKHNSKVFFGYDIKKINHLLDYYLIENHAFKNKEQVDNSHLNEVINSCGKPVFILSYKNGIGNEPGFNQQQLDLIYSEANNLNYCPCIKGSEYRTKGVWHLLNLNDLKQPQKDLPYEINHKEYKSRLRTRPIIPYHLPFWNKYYTALMRFLYDNKYANELFHRSYIYTKGIRSIKNYEI